MPLPIPNALDVRVIPCPVQTAIQEQPGSADTRKLPGPPPTANPVLTGSIACTQVAKTMRWAWLIAVPPGVVTRTRPLVAPGGTIAVIDISEVTVKLAATPLNVTLVAAVRLVPVMAMGLPTAAFVG